MKKQNPDYMSAVKFLARMIDAQDAYTENHSERVSVLAVRAGKKMGLSAHQCAVIRDASLLHDIGKIGIDMSILRKRSPLSETEWKQVRQHPVIGAEIVKKIGILDDLVPAIFYHHTFYDGGGYPDSQRKRESLPIEARVLTVADSFESMTSDRPYRRHMTKTRALEELERWTGSQFDPAIVRVFIQHL